MARRPRYGLRSAPFCAIKEWLPPVGACIEDGKSPSTRTLVTKDGKAAPVETQTARNDARYTYSYKFQANPLPVRDYVSTIKVVSKDKDTFTVTRSGSLKVLHRRRVAFGLRDQGV